MKNRNSKQFSIRAAMMLLLAVTATLAAHATTFITDVKVIGGTKAETNALKETLVADGWIDTNYDLNKGCGSSSDYIYLLYKAVENTDGVNWGYITDFYISNAEGTAPDTRSVGGRTYHLVPYDGGDNFKNSKGDLNRGADGDFIHLYYTKDLFPDYRAITSIGFDNTQSGAVGLEGGTTGYDLNEDCGSGTDYIYMHITTATAMAGHQPQSSLEACTASKYQIAVSGWAYDPDATAQSIGVQVKIYQSDGTTLYRTENLTANRANANAGVSGNHGFAGTFTNIPAGTYKVMLYAKDYNGDGDTQIGTTRTVTVTGTQPSGRIDACNGGVGQITLSGWAYDPDATTESIGVQVKVYQSNGTTLYKTENLTADRPRNDVNNTYNITGQHGYSATIAIAAGGTYKVMVYAIDHNGDGNPQIGSTQTVTVTPGATLTSETGEVTLQNGDILTGTGGANTHVTIAAGATVTLSGVTITSIAYNNNHQWAGITCAGNATIILADGTTNSVQGGYLNYPGIQAGPSGTTLTIRGSGTLTATGCQYAAGIGGGDGIICGNIVISGGNVTAKGGMYAAGIGCGNNGSRCGTITISGGIVTATGGAYAASIGSSTNSSICGSVTISGGTVTAKGGGGAAGIGSGNGDSRCGTITISGGTVNATGGTNGAGIGNGSNISNSLTNSCSGVAISGGTVTATGGEKAAGIGSGYGQYSIFGTATISGGNVTATGGVQGAGIGCGCGSSSSNSQTQCHSITINGGTVTATGGSYAAGIGSSYQSNCGPVTITNEAVKVTAIKGSGAPTSIGNGQNGTCGEVTIGGTSYSNGITESPYICPVMTFADGTAYSNTDDYYVARAIYTKTLGESRVGKHQAWLVPFDYTLTAEDLQKFNFYKINMIANSPSPEVEASEQMWLFLTKLNAGDVLHANMPYVYKPKEAVTNYAFTSINTTLKAKNTGVIAKSETLEDVYSFYATYENTTPPSNDPFYYVNINGSISLGNNGSVTVGPYRWIIRKTSKFGETPSYAPGMRFFDGEEDDDADAICTIDNGQLMIENEEDAWYDLNGRKVAKGQKPTARGLYIHNGRKEAIR